MFTDFDVLPMMYEAVSHKSKNNKNYCIKRKTNSEQN